MCCVLSGLPPSSSDQAALLLAPPTHQRACLLCDRTGPMWHASPPTALHQNFHKLPPHRGPCASTCLNHGLDQLCHRDRSDTVTPTVQQASGWAGTPCCCHTINRPRVLKGTVLQLLALPGIHFLGGEGPAQATHRCPGAHTKQP
jgi:hypothetical protein